MEDGKDLYYQERIEGYIDDDEISATEEGFMRGYLRTS